MSAASDGPAGFRDRLEGAEPNGRRRVVVIASLTRSLVNFRLELLKAIVHAGHHVTALAPDDDALSVAELARHGVQFEQIPMARTGTNPLVDAWTLARLYVSLRRLRPDVVLAYTMKPIIYGGLAARLAGVPKRCALFTGFGFMFGENARRPITALVFNLSVCLYRSALKGAEVAFAYNDADVSDIRRLSLVERETPVVLIAGSGVDLERFRSAPPSCGAPVFLLVARLLREKGLAEFAAAARVLKPEFPNARFQVLGPPDPGPLGIPSADLEAWTTGGDIEYLGETRDVLPFLRDCSVFVLPSYYREGIPRSALEALAAGRPIVTTSAPGCRETVVDGENGFCIPPRDVDALAAAMRFFLQDENAAARMGVCSRRLAERRFDVHALNRVLMDNLGLSCADGTGRVEG